MAAINFDDGNLKSQNYGPFFDKTAFQQNFIVFPKQRESVSTENLSQRKSMIFKSRENSRGHR